MKISRNTTYGNGSPIFNNNGDVINNYPRIEMINPYNLKIIIEFLEHELQGDILADESKEDDEDFKRIDITKKNEINRLEEEGCTDYFNCILESSIYFKTIKDILSNPRNKNLKKSYNNIKKTIKNKIPDIKRDKKYFSQVLNEIIDRFLNSNDITILKNEEMVSVIIHFMYYICHIGDNYVET